eukprot:CAMPEP_0194158066 /NCGR_PEP_ID=MMETSP0152-20130528/74556_1 /TAXON_ID=1049557 /ORGANISM="Thalassiothrix antarctica, Strain L6-D1" /LENGTH=2143 /DNA_ID=CAMNT_0038866995 /DNA_START=775 /DNA_END=7206 /DNA_ORIENTATION=-
MATQGNAEIDGMEALLVPLAVHSSSRRLSNMVTAKPSSWSQLVSLTKQAAQFHENQPIPAPSLRTPSQNACQISGIVRMLPLHIAAQYGVKFEILKGLCRQFPEGAHMQIPWRELSPVQSKIQPPPKDSSKENQDDCQNGSHPSTIVEEDEEVDEEIEVESDDNCGMESKCANDCNEINDEHVGGASAPKRGSKRTTEDTSAETEKTESLKRLEGEDEEEPWEEESLRTPDSTDDESFDFDEESESRIHDEVDDYETQHPLQQTLLSALEIFERGRAFQEASATLRKHETGDIDESQLEDIWAYYTKRSDLLLAYNTKAINKETGQYYIDDHTRLARLESQIQQEVSENGSPQISDTMARVWMYLAQYVDEIDPKKYIRLIGRILTSLTPSGLWKLTVIPQVGRDVFIKIAATNRTIVQEAELRSPATRMEHMLKYYWFQYLLTTYLDPINALNYSVSCRYTRARGVRLIPQVPLRVTEASWQKSETAVENTPPKPWQRLDIMVIPDYTHSVFVTYFVEFKSSIENENKGQQKENGTFGGMLVVRDDNRKLRPNVNEPWGNAVVAHTKVSPLSRSVVRLSFQHVPGRSYGLWHYNKGVAGSSLSVSNVCVRQLLHSCDPRGRSPLHLLMSSMTDQPSNPKLNKQISLLLSAKFGSGDSVGDVQLHYALKCGVNEDVLTSIITSSPGSLIETDKEGRTPMHAAFLMSKEVPASLGIIRALLIPPGGNAIRLKDSSGNLPIHIAAERGVEEVILRMLVEAYQDGCYRTNKYVDLPLHLLIKSGTATTTTVELLLRPIMQNESICKIGGSQGSILPLHIAAEYQCSFKVLEKLLQTYGDAALLERKVGKTRESEGVKSEFALDIFENAKGNHYNEKLIESFENISFGAKEAAKLDIKSAEFMLRSDLIFVYNPFLIDQKTRKPYRSNRERIRRLENMIRREASQCGEDRKVNRRANLSHMATQGWIFLCTYNNADDPSDNFAGTVRRILRGMSANAVDVLAHVENPKSIPQPNMMIKDCAASVCQLLIMSRLRFVGRYVLYDEIHPAHKSDSCLVMRAEDHGLAGMYKRLMTIYDVKEQQVEDDISDAGSEPPEVTDANEPNEVTVEMFVNFAIKMGIQVEMARKEILNLLKLENNKNVQSENTSNVTEGHQGMVSSNSKGQTGEFTKDDEMLQVKKNDFDDENTLEVGKESFTTFCRAHRLNDKGVRTVVIKFMKNAMQFKREIEVRDVMNLSSTSWRVVPILDDYNVDRIEASRRRDIDIISLRDEMAEDSISGAPENRDELYALDIQEKNASVHNFALYKYAVVLPAGDRDLGEICQHEELGILQIREYMLQVGLALRSLHAESIMHGDLKMDNVVRFGKNLALIDFDGAYKFGLKNPGDKIGGCSSKFCTGVLPPEMITRIDLISDFPQLTQYEDYWRGVSDDAKDVNLLTPDDIQTITSVIKSLLEKADVARNLHKSIPRGLRDEMSNLYNDGLENRNDWKDILSVSLMTLSFDDLPFSLNRCEEVEEFANVWNRLLFHAKLWKKLKPKITADEKFAYLVKTHNDIPDKSGIIEKADSSTIPYALVEPSEKIDVWGFGVLLYSLCTGGTLFHLGFDGDLHNSEDFLELFEWDKCKAERIFRTNVDDPLAQDLLLNILVAEDIRLPNIAAILEHPFFGPSSSPDAQRILERHEEEQLIEEETFVIKRMTTETRRKIERSMERQCKIIFDEDKIVVPTCLIVVPYNLERAGSRLIVKSESSHDLAVKIGEYLLQINKITAKLSFFLLVKQSLGGDANQTMTFKTKLKNWVKRSGSESSDQLSAEILKEIDCGKEYTRLCIEILEEGEQCSLAFFSDPMATARRAISDVTEVLMRCYQSSQNLYLVDEMNGVPVRSEEDINDDLDELVYPIELDRTVNMLRTLLLPFMNVAVMKLTAAEGLPALGKLLGLPHLKELPNSWLDGKAGLVHRPEKPSSIAEFAVLHEVMRRQEFSASPGSATLSHNDVAQSGDEMARLEDFFRGYDPVRTFADLRRVSDGKEGSPAIWTTEVEVNQMQSQLELASAEYKLRELKKEWIKRQKVQEEIQTLTNEIERLHGKSNLLNNRQDPSTTLLLNNERNSFPTQSFGQYNLEKESSVILHSERAAEKRPTKRKKTRFRPYFGAC